MKIRLNVYLSPAFASLILMYMKRFCLTAFLITFISQTQLIAQKSWTNIFDGKTLDGWKQMAGKAEYNVYQGMIIGVSVPGSPNSFLCTTAEYSDFALEMEVLVEDTSINSGIQFRSHFDQHANHGLGKVFGYQYEIDPSVREWSGGIYDEGRREWL